jgi:hypothetical protein
VVKHSRAVFFWTKLFPQGFHSGPGFPKLHKSFKKAHLAAKTGTFRSIPLELLSHKQATVCQIARGPRKIRDGRKKRDLKNNKTPSTAIPTMRNGNRMSQIKG